MEVSLYLAKSLGIYFIVLSAGMVINAKSVKSIYVNMIKSPEWMYIGGIVALILGVLMVNVHNIWVLDWRVLITISGWMALLKGVSLVVFPMAVETSSAKWVENPIAYNATIVFMVVLGAILLYKGFGY